MVTQEAAAHTAQRIVVALATAARTAGVTHLRMRSGPVREMVLLPADPPVDGAAEHDPEPDPHASREARQARLGAL